MQDDNHDYGQEYLDSAPPHSAPKKSPPKKKAQSKKPQDLAEHIVTEVEELLEKKFSDFEQSSQEVLSYLDNVTKAVQNAGDQLTSAANSYIAKSKQFSTKHITFVDLPKVTKTVVFGGFFIALTAGLGVGVISQEKFSLYDSSGGWNKYVIESYLTRIQRCRSQAKKAGKSINCNIVENP